MRAFIIAALIIAAFWGLVLWLAARNERRAETAHPPTGVFVDVGGTSIHAEVSGSGPNVVLLHGSSGSTRDMTFRLAPALSKHYRVISFDRPGLGYSARPNQGGLSISAQADLLMKAARKLGADKPIILGQSYGGAVALAWAVHHPQAVSALVLVSAVTNPWTIPLDPLYRVTSTRLGSALIVPVITAFAPDYFVGKALESIFAPQGVPQDYASHFGPRLSLRRAPMRANASQRANLLAEIQTLHRRYGEIAVPTEIVHGDVDPLVDPELHAETLVLQVPNARLNRIERIGHMPHHVSVDVVADTVHRAAARAGLR